MGVGVVKEILICINTLWVELELGGLIYDVCNVCMSVALIQVTPFSYEVPWEWN
jgi:hypothetical protein